MRSPITSAILGDQGTSVIFLNIARKCSCGVVSEGHFKWECPLRYATLIGKPCPGFDINGKKDLTQWKDGNRGKASKMTKSTRVAWQTYAKVLAQQEWYPHLPSPDFKLNHDGPQMAVRVK